MKLAIAVIALVSFATPAVAQGFPKGIDHSSYVEANRPRIAARKLSGSEAGAMRKALSSVASAPSETALLALKPYAESGDPAAIRAMMAGYNRLLEKTTREDPKLVRNSFKGKNGGPIWPRPIPATADRYEDRYAALAGMWAMALFRLGPPVDGEAGATLKQCVAPANSDISPNYWVKEMQYTGARKNFDCGFDTYTSFGAFIAMGQSLRGNRMVPAQPYRFVERPVIAQAELDKLRWTRSMLWLSGMDFKEGFYHDRIDEPDYKWARESTYRQPELYAQWIAAQFDHEVRMARKNHTEITAGTDVWLYMKADPKREQRYQDQLAGYYGDLAAKRRYFTETMAGRGQMSQYELAQVALREGGAFAEQYWNKYGERGGIGVYAFQLCNAGSGSACEDGKRRAVAAADTPTATSGGMFSQAQLDAQLGAFRAREAAINRGNCARASLGASITCNR